MTTDTYHLSVESGEIKEVSGFFFKAAPFEVHINNKIILCNFKRNQNHHVTYELSSNGTFISEIDHPDYTPDESPENLAPKEISKEEYLSVIDAFIRLGIGKGKEYLKLEQKPTYKVHQKPFM